MMSVPVFRSFRRTAAAAALLAAAGLDGAALAQSHGGGKPPPTAPNSQTPADLNPALRSPLLSSQVMSGADAHVKPTAADWRTVPADDLLVIDTNKGRIIAELAPRAAPATVERVKTLARQHFYDGQSFFRVIDAFMAQTGDPKNSGEGGSTLPNLKAEFTFRRDAATPFVVVTSPSSKLEGVMGSLPVASEPDALMVMTTDGKVPAWGLFCPGVLGMARAGDPDSANSQFFLMRQTYTSLDKTYAAFGRVVVGEDVVRALKVGEPPAAPVDQMTRVRLASDLPPAERPSVRVLSASSAAFRDIAERERIDKGSDFSVCDIDIPAEVDAPKGR